MEGIGSEVSQKIRAAIKAKLIELGAYVDDELPDYIMVMVANKRTKSQMDEDLQLFLTSNTKVFTSWLHTVLQKLQEVTVANFENKKDLEDRKAKLKKSEIIYNSKSRKSSEEGLGRLKKHGKKHKDSKKSKKAKHKSKEKSKLKSEKKEKGETKERLEKKGDSLKMDQSSEETVKNTDSEKVSKKNQTALNVEAEKTGVDKLRQNKLPHQDKADYFNGDSSGENSSNLSNKTGPEKETSTVIKPDIAEIKKSVIEDEFNIEPLKPNEKCNELDFQKEYLHKSPNRLEPTTAVDEVEKTISAPTEELLKEHNKIQNQKLEEEKNEEKKLKSDSEESVSPEEMRKQLLLSRAKKKLEHSKIADRMRSNSPDVLILDESNRRLDKDTDFCTSSRFDSFKQTDFRSSKSPPLRSGDLSKNSSVKKSPSRMRFSPSSFSSDLRKSTSPKKLISTKSSKDEKSKSNKQKSSNNEDVKTSSVEFERENEKRRTSDFVEKKKQVIKISENLELEKNLGVKREGDSSKASQKDYSSRKKSVLSRVVTITGPEAPEISSIVKVKPREYISKDKQANKALILKAVAEAQKSIATVPARPEPEKETKKETLFTKNLRQKHFEKLAVTLSNIRRSPDSRDRRPSVDSEKSDKSKNNFDGLEGAEGDRGKSSKKMSKSEDQFISSKTTVLEKNDKYIRCWLEGVQQAVIDEEMVNPQELEDVIIHSNFTDEDNEGIQDEISRGSEGRKRKLEENSEDAFHEKMSKNAKLSDKEIANLRVIPTSTAKEEGPQIVVTLDGLDTKVIKDIILRNKEAKNGPILLSTRKPFEKEKVTKVVQKNSGSSKEKSPSDSRKLSFQKISDRFARLNKSREDTDSEREKSDSKFSKHQSSDADKEKKSKVSTESKNRLLIAQLSEKFGKVDREFENKKRKYPEGDRRCIYGSRKIEKDDIERNGKYKKSEKRSGRRDSLSPPPSKYSASISSQFCKFYPNCKNLDCLYFHPKKCRFDEDCKNPDCKYVHSEVYSRKSKWYSKS